MKIKIMKSDRSEEIIHNVQAVIFDQEEENLRVHYLKDSGIYLFKTDPRDFKCSELLAFIVEK